MIKYILEIWWESSSPATIRLTNGAIAPWLRYAEWLLTCPVILIALSRVGKAEGNYSRRTMKLLTSDQGTIIMGVTAAYSKGVVKICFFFVGLIYGFNTFYTAATVYLEAFRNVPDDLKGLVKYMTYIFYSSWVMFPILFVAGPEGFGHISPAGSVIGHTIADLLSKNLWGIFDWWYGSASRHFFSFFLLLSSCFFLLRSSCAFKASSSPCHATKHHNGQR